MQIQEKIYCALLILVIGFAKIFGAIKCVGKVIVETCQVILFLGAFFSAVADISVNERLLKKRYTPR